MQHFSRYLKVITLTTPIFLLSVIIFNYLNDSLNSEARILKARAVHQLKPTSIVLGTSRGEFGIDPEHPGLKKPAYNLAITGSNIYVTFRYLQHAEEIQPLQQVLLMVDFFMFNTNETDGVNFSEELLAVDAEGNSQSFLNQLVSLKMLTSLDTTFSHIRRQEKQFTNTPYFPNGMRSSPRLTIGHHQAFLNNELGYMRSFYNLFSFSTPERDNLQIYQKILILAQQKEIDLHIAISGSHARQFEVIATLGLWDDFEWWKQQLVALNESVASQHEKASFPVWDFSNYNSYNAEALPEKGDLDTKMQWYWESSHYKKELGNLMLDRIFNYTHPERTIDDNFGVLITTDNIESHLAQIRTNREKWRNDFPEYVAEITRLQARKRN
jgi:hypothetical protein